MKMLIHDCMEEFKNYVQSYCADATVEYYTLNLRLLEKFLLEKYSILEMDINVLQKKDYIAYIAYHKGRVKNVSVRTYARAAKVFFRWCYTEGYLLEDITKNVKQPKPDNAIIIPLSALQVALLENVLLSSSWMPDRNYCIFKLLLDCGLRVGEVCKLDVLDIDFVNDYLSINCSKNCRSRLIPLPPALKKSILDYLEVTDRVSNNQGPLFLERDGVTRITENAISILFGKLKKFVPGIYPHLLRHTFATSFVLGGGNLEVLRILLGHTDYNVTRQYLHIASQLQLTDFDIYKLDPVFFKTYNYNKRE